MKTSIAATSRRRPGCKHLLLSTALATILAPGIASAGICELIDADTATEDGGGSHNDPPDAFTEDQLACGHHNLTSGEGGSAFGVRNRAFDGSLSAGFQNDAYGRSLATGWFNSADGQSAALGYSNSASDHSLAAGWDNSASDQSAAIGYANTASDNRSLALGNHNTAQGSEDAGSLGSLAIGDGNLAYYGANAVGTGNQAFGYSNSLVGHNNTARSAIDGNGDGQYQESEYNGFVSILGSSNSVSGSGSLAAGYRNTVAAFLGTAMGASNIVAGEAGLGAGTATFAANAGGTALGGARLDLDLASRFPEDRVEGEQFSLVVGGRELEFVWQEPDNPSSSKNIASIDGHAMAVTETGDEMLFSIDGQEVGYLEFQGYLQSALQGGTVAFGTDATAVGAASTAWGERAVALGSNAHAVNDDSVAIGSGAVATRGNSVSFGHDDMQRQLTQVAAGTAGTDAVNLSQLQPLATALGGGAYYADGVFTAPTYTIQGSDYGDVGAAFAAVDGRFTDLYALIDGVGGAPGPAGPAGPTGPQGPEGPPGGGPRTVVYDQDSGDTLTLTGEQGTRISNLADGVAATDAVNKGQMEAGDAAALAQANAYADQTATVALQSANAYTDAVFAGFQDDFDRFRGDVDRRFHEQDRRIDRLSAMSGAYAGMAMNTAGLAGRNRIGVGFGAQAGEAAMAIGYQRAVGDRASVSFGGAISGGEASVMGGAGFSW